MKTQSQIIRANLWALGLIALTLGCSRGSGEVQDLVVGTGTMDPATYRAKLRRPLKLSMAYEVKERFALEGGGYWCHSNIYFKFTNTTPFPVSMSFPPIAVFSGGVLPFADAGDDGVPEFARAEQIVQFAPGESRSYTHLIASNGPPGQFEWVFGKPSDGSKPENLYVGTLFSEENAPKPSEDNSQKP